MKDQIFKISTISAGLAGTLIDPVTITVTGPLSEDKGGALVTVIIVDASWARGSIIFKVTT